MKQPSWALTYRWRAEMAGGRVVTPLHRTGRLADQRQCSGRCLPGSVPQASNLCSRSPRKTPIQYKDKADPSQLALFKRCGRLQNAGVLQSFGQPADSILAGIKNSAVNTKLVGEAGNGLEN
jgi:hypothetical protein